jgi:Tol biopolymer transport system component
MIDQIKRYLLIIKEYWAYSIAIVLFVLACFFLVMSGAIKIPPFFSSSFFPITFVVLFLVNCFLVINIKHIDETNYQSLFRYCKIGFFFPVLGLIAIWTGGDKGFLASLIRHSLSGSIAAFCLMAGFSLTLSIDIGYWTRFIITVRSSSTFFSPKLRIITVQLLSVLMIFLIWTLAGGYDNFIKEKNAVSISKISFSPDGKKIIFNCEKGYLPNMIHVYDLETKDLIAYQPPKGEYWSGARYSPDGSKIVFVTIPSGNYFKYSEHDKAQLAVMDTDGKNIRKITNTDSYKNDPSFSHSGRKIIFSRSDIIRKNERTPHAGFDAYEVDVETGLETRLTHFKFIGVISNLYYFPDDKTFIFRGEYPTAYPAIPDSDGNDAVMDKIRKELQSKYKYNSIYVMQANEKELKPYLVMPEYQKKFKMYVGVSESSRDPSLSADGSVLVFMSIGYNPDGSAMGHQLYQYSADGNHRQITQFPFPSTSIQSHAVSPNGEFVAIVNSVQTTNKILLYQIKDGTTREITLPDQPSRIINRDE